jgi:hypothetical protein
VCDNRALRRIFGHNREEVAGDWRKLCNVGLRNFYASLNVTGMIKSMTRWAEHVARVG